MAPQFIYLIYLSLFAVLGSSAQNECQVENCSQHGPAFRFPFRLRDRHQQHCGYPGFELHCNQNNDTVLELPFPVKATINDSNLPFLVQFAIEEIDYKNQFIEISQIFGCFAGLLPLLNLTASPFQFLYAYNNFTYFNCSKIKRYNNDYLNPVPCLSSKDYDVYTVGSNYPLYYLPLQSCSKMFDLHESIPWGVFYSYLLPITLEWSRPNCTRCESIGKHCRLKNDSSILHDTECYNNSSKPEGNFTYIFCYTDFGSVFN